MKEDLIQNLPNDLGFRIIPASKNEQVLLNFHLGEKVYHCPPFREACYYPFQSTLAVECVQSDGTIVRRCFECTNITWEIIPVSAS